MFCCLDEARHDLGAFHLRRQSGLLDPDLPGYGPETGNSSLFLRVKVASEICVEYSSLTFSLTSVKMCMISSPLQRETQLTHSHTSLRTRSFTSFGLAQICKENYYWGIHTWGSVRSVRDTKPGWNRTPNLDSWRRHISARLPRQSGNRLLMGGSSWN